MFFLLPTDELCNIHINLTTEELFDIKSLNFPHPYPRDLECVWLVTAQNGGSAIVVHILHFSTEFEDDILSMGYGHDINGANTLLEKLSGSWFFKSLTVLDSKMWLHFVTDRALEKSGFHLQLEWRQSVGRLCLC